MRLAAACLVLHAAAAKKSRRCAAPGDQSSTNEASTGTSSKAGASVARYTCHDDTGIAPLAESMRSLTALLSLPQQNGMTLDELCSGMARTVLWVMYLSYHIKPQGRSNRPLGFSASQAGLRSRLRELMHPEGRLLIATTNNATRHYHRKVVRRCWTPLARSSQETQ